MVLLLDHIYIIFSNEGYGWNGIYNIAANPNTTCIDPSSCLPMVDLPALYIYDAVYMWFNVKTLDNPIIELLFFILLISDCLVQAQPLREDTQFGKLWPIQSYHWPIQFLFYGTVLTILYLFFYWILNYISAD